MIDGFLAEILIFFSDRKIVATQTFISFSGKISCLKTGSCFFTRNYFLKKPVLVLSVTHALAGWYRYDTPQHKKIIWGSGWGFFGVSSSDQAAVPAPSFNRVFELFFLNEMSRRTDTHCQQGKNTGPHTPPRVRWEQKMNTKAGGRGRVDPTPFCLARGESKNCNAVSLK